MVYWAMGEMTEFVPDSGKQCDKSKKKKNGFMGSKWTG